jgi:hypothetical protein
MVAEIKAPATVAGFHPYVIAMLVIEHSAIDRDAPIMAFGLHQRGTAIAIDGDRYSVSSRRGRWLLVSWEPKAYRGGKGQIDVCVEILDFRENGLAAEVRAWPLS